MTELTQKYLLECFDYNPDTGKLVWKIRPKEHFKTIHSCNRINTRCAGHEFGWVHNYSRGPDYIYGKINGKTYKAHRIIWMMLHGEWPDQVDHRDRNGLNNRPNNLRNVTQSENLKHKKRYKNNTSGVTGVMWSKRACRWIAAIGINGKKKQLGSFFDIDEAIAVRLAAEKKYGYNENHGREL